MGEHAEGLGKPPGREGVGRIALVEDGKGRDEALVGQVGIEVGELLGQEHALVDQRTRREGADVEIADRRFAHALFDAPPAQIEFALQLVQIAVFADVEHDLLDFGPCGVGLLADDGDVHRHLAPAIEIEVETQDLRFDDGAAGLLCHIVCARQEYLAHGDAARAEFVSGLGHGHAEEFLRHLDMDAGTVAGLAVGVDGAAVPHGLQRLDAAGHDFAARCAVDRRDQADAAGIVLLVGRIKVTVFECLRIFEIARNFGRAAFAIGGGWLRFGVRARQFRGRGAEHAHHRNSFT